MIELVIVNFATIGFTLTTITLIKLAINSFKIPMILGIVLSVPVRFSHLIVWKVIKILPYVWVTFTIIINPGKTTTMKAPSYWSLKKN